ncbi:S8 family serine peptidase, partial [bacterium]|nr:S8 family serine peptidase [bacterium]
MIKKTMLLLLILTVSVYSQTKFVPGSVLIRIEQQLNLTTVNGKDITGIEKLDSILDKLNVRKIRKPFGQTVSSYNDKEKILLIDLPKTMNLDHAIQLLKQVEGVSWAVKHNIYESSFIPDDPLYADQYYLPQVNADEGWDLLGSNTGTVIIGIIDSGVEYTHPDLVSKIYINPAEDKPPLGELTPADYDGIDDDLNGLVDDLIGWDFVDAPDVPIGQDYLAADNDPMDTYGHGTAMSGIAAAEFDNGIGIAGIAPNALIMPLRAASADLFTETAVVAAILYAVEEGADVLNMSFGTEVNSPLLQDIMAYAAGNDVVLVASAGNYGGEVIFYPAAYDQTISVGAVDASDIIADFSYRGETMDIVAPGVGLISTTLNGGYGLTMEGGTGTSFAVPLVAGAAALIKGQHPNYSAEEIKGVLLASAEDLYAPGWDTLSASGRLDVKSASMIPAGISALINEPQNGSAFNGDT